MIKTKTAPIKAVKVQETKTKTFSISTHKILDSTENKRIRNAEIVDLTDNDRKFLKDISDSYKESYLAYDNEIQFNINLVGLDIYEMVGTCLVYKANIDLAKFIYNLLFDNICDSNLDKPIYTHLHIYTYDNDVD